MYKGAIWGKQIGNPGYYEELLRLVYRLIFLFAAEDRGLLHIPNAPHTAKNAYRHGYSVSRLRKRCIRNTALDRHHDAWAGLRASFDAVATGEPRLGLAALGGLFTPSNLADLTRSRIANRRLLKAIWHLSWFRPDGQPMTRVNWRDMQTEELGSVYESLLELIPLVHLEARAFAFAAGDAANRGNERKTTGSYYTPDSLVPLYEAKMIHHFDHRFGSYAGLNSRPSGGSLPETPESAKASPDYESDPWYWVPEDETALRVARVPARLKQYFRKENAEGCLKVLAEWVLGTLEPGDLETASLARAAPLTESRLRDVLV